MSQARTPSTTVPVPARWVPQVRLGWETRNARWWLWGAAGTVVVVAGVAMAWWGMFPVNVHGPGHFAGIMAPTCGLTRSVVAVFRGDSAMAWRYNPLGLLVAFGAVAALARLAAGAVTGRWLVLRVRPGRAGWIALTLAVVALEIRQQGRAELLMTTGLH
ncbi:hypothetical protein GCM10010095_21590 [Streptomyces anthocyanicus]|uniref:DUF2752 domain-containing protein n=1 Tax=Streptomyces anthocyanicus TaxID=68174 RepID=UPI00166FEDBB|nr:DUF2752 domain-containing protein [Streptomyces anthocyanicus]GGL36057.1 hypothetical protein GCM10010095_21590 [Streptomyces anthocyanicus]